ncbi:MAG: addiction module antidote protein, HigA family [Candidatus Fraserbacteria bacterium RBG_16_55_9]|uniref:Addiction module antidote protein, HigA family n=1 Tax=Fraserbacteria sp. (strain RBG_16_55_9) TaxID=1817864 RepID=A0A1F5UPG1_FRAXR|nr:MAG: addiction module antidote protein, HigA family [Candidatus Fraserbacteria bacterium RBG_16_55_9]
MIPTNRKPTHPGRILDEMYLKPLHISLRSFGAVTGISRKHLSRVINGHARVSVEIATKLAATLSTTPELWVNAQRNVDIYEARQRLREWKPKKVFKALELQRVP